jgi:hypothetical protein
MDCKKGIKEEIARLAYEIYEQTGICGREEDNWLEAERIVLERMSVWEPSKANKKLVPSRNKTGTTKKKKVPGAKV